MMGYVMFLRLAKRHPRTAMQKIVHGCVFRVSGMGVRCAGTGVSKPLRERQRSDHSTKMPLGTRSNWNSYGSTVYTYTKVCSPCAKGLITTHR